MGSLQEEKQQTLLILSTRQRWFGHATEFKELRLPDNNKASEIILRVLEPEETPPQEKQFQGLRLTYSFAESRYAQRKELYGALNHHKKTLAEIRIAARAADSARHELENSAHDVAEEDLQFAARECRLLKQTLAQKQQQKTIECKQTQTTITINVPYNSFAEVTDGPYPLLLALTRHAPTTQPTTSITTDSVSVLLDTDGPITCVPTEFPTIFLLPQQQDKIKEILFIGESQLAMYSARDLWECTPHNGTIVARRLLTLDEDIRSISASGNRVYISIVYKKQIEVYDYDPQKPLDSKLTRFGTLGDYHHYPGKRHHNVGELKSPTFVATTGTTTFIVDPALKRMQLYSPLHEWRKQVKLPPNCEATGVATYNEHMFLCDSHNRRVYRFDTSGIICATFQIEGDLDWVPVACVYSRGCLVVLDNVGALCHFNLQGKLLRKDPPQVGHTYGSLTVHTPTEQIWFHSNTQVLKYD